MRTTVRLNDALLTEAKRYAAETGTSLTSVIEDALREAFSRRHQAAKQPEKIKFPTFKGNGLQPGIDLDSSACLLDVMDDLQ